MKNYLLFVLKGLFSNKTLVDGRKKPIWSSIIVGLLSIIIAVVPTLVSTGRQKGSTCLTSSTNGSLDVSLTLFSKQLVDENITLKVENKEIVTTFTETVVKAQSRDLLGVSYCETEEDIDAAKEKYENYFTFTTEDGVEKKGPISYMLITKTDFYIAVYKNEVTHTYNKNGTVKTKASTIGSFSGKVSEVEGLDFATFYDASSQTAKADCVSKWKVALNDMYKPVKQGLMVTYSLIICGLNLGVVVLVSFMLFILTKLKSNQGVKLTYLESVTIACYAALSPALITCIVGLVYSMISTIGFVLFLGLRSTFLGIKATAPQEQAK